MIIGCSRLPGGRYWVVIDDGGRVYGEVWTARPPGVHIDGY